jgi:nitrate/nitrite-specific signal transduction histidine kinase
MPDHKVRRRGLAIKIIIWSFVPTIAILLSVAVVTFLAYQKVTQDLVMERDTQVTRLSAGQLSNELKNYTELLTDIARASDFRQEGSSRGWNALRDAANRLVVFDGGVVALDVHGNIFATSADRREVLGQDWSNRPYFREIVRFLQPVYSDILKDGPQNAEVITAAVPIFGDQGELLGVLVGMFRIRASAVSAFYGGIVKQRLVESGRTYLVDGNGKVIYHVDSQRIGADFSNEPVVQSLLNGEAGASRTRNLEGDDVVAGYSPVPGTTWGIVTEESWSALTSSSQGYRQFLLILIIAGFVIPIIFVGVGVGRITRPINDLIVAAQEVAQGNFDQSISADTGDEIEELAEQFSQMASQLRESYAQLEQRVAERTHELESLYLADEELYRHLDLDQVLQTLVSVSKKILNADKSAIIVWDRQIGKLIVRASEGFSSETLEHMIFEPGEGIVGKVAITGIPAIVEDSWETADVSTRITDPEGIRSFMHVPIKAGDLVFGVFNVAHHQPRAFGDTEQRLLLALAQRASLAVENAQLYEQAQLVAAVEERQRLARELHDAVTQSLFSASLIAEVLTRLWDKNPEEGKRRLEELRHLTRGALAEMRTLLLELRPTALMEAEVHELFRHLCDAFSGRTMVNVRCNLEGDCDLPAEIKIAIYRIAQETLNNIAKHAQANNVEMSLNCQNGNVVLDIFDDGRGFNPGVVPSDHLGLNIMQERAQRIGAELDINSVLGEGTRVRVTWDGGEKKSGPR